MSAAARPPLPSSGDLAEHPLPRVILDLWRRAFTGTLRLESGADRKSFAWRQGAPVASESSRTDDALGPQLLASGRITQEQLETLVAHRQSHGVAESAALLGLKLVEPKDLVQAMREQISRRMVDAFGWSRGRFDLDDAQTPGEETDAFRVDPLEILQDGLAAYWRPDRILGDLGTQLELHAAPSDTFPALAARLRPGPDTEAVTGAIDPARSFGAAVATSLAPARLAVAWVLSETGALEFSEGPPAPDAAPGAAPDGGSPFAFEIEVREAGAVDASVDLDSDAEALELPSPEAEALSKEVMALHERLDELDHYEVLGLEPDAANPAVKKAYYAASKRFHPDAVARLGLAAIHREANELFARIAHAYQTLSDPNRRQAYDHRDDEGATPSNVANRVAQAETLFRKGEVLVKVGNFEGALDFLRPCVEVWPEEADYQALLGWALYKARPSDPEAAREHLERADALRADDALTLFRLGMVLRKLGETEAGQGYLDRSKSIEKAAKG